MKSIGKIAFTADTHLSRQNPERLEVLKYILEDLASDGPGTLLIAGDLLDKDFKGYEEADALFASVPQISIHIIPGNHDPGLRQELFAAPGVRIHSKPALEYINGHPFLFLPYTAGSAMGTCIQDFSDDLPREKWVLVSHGECGNVSGSFIPRDDAYFPLYRTDRDRFMPGAVLLGHIHNLASESLEKKIYYPGSPFPVDRHETGIRKYGILTEDFSVKWREIPLGPLYWASTLLILPSPGEEDDIRNRVNALAGEIKRRFGSHISRLTLYLNVCGYTSAGRDFAGRILEEGLAFIPFVKADYSELSAVSSTGIRTGMARRVRELIEGMDIESSPLAPGKQEVLRSALGIIYGKN